MVAHFRGRSSDSKHEQAGTQRARNKEEEKDRNKNKRKTKNANFLHSFCRIDFTQEEAAYSPVERSRFRFDSSSEDESSTSDDDDEGADEPRPGFDYKMTDSSLDNDSSQQISDLAMLIGKP